MRKKGRRSQCLYAKREAYSATSRRQTESMAERVQDGRKILAEATKVKIELATEMGARELLPKSRDLRQAVGIENVGHDPSHIVAGAVASDLNGVLIAPFGVQRELNVLEPVLDWLIARVEAISSDLENSRERNRQSCLLWL